MLKSQLILNRFCSNFGFYISGPILTKYIIPHKISTNPQLQISKSQIIQMLISQSIFHRFGSNFGFYISWPIFTKYMILHQISPNPQLHISNTSNAYISVNFPPICVKLWILHLMTNLNKVCDTTPNLKHLKSQLISTTSNA